ncbi:MAG: GNAT family N-acetyltransferase [Candidatus Binataceae bacterium]
MPNAKPQVSLIFPDQYPEAAAMLGRAFVDDPLLKAIVANTADPAQRSTRMTHLFNVMLKGHRHDGQPVIGVIRERQVAGAAIVEYVRRPNPTAMIIISGLTLIPELMRAGGLGAVSRAISVLDTLTRHRPSEPHIYLNVLGVEPELQRNHYGVAILDFLRDQAAARSDLAGVYLETATESNVSYYSHFGYRVLNEFSPLGVRMWRMMQPRIVSV